MRTVLNVSECIASSLPETEFGYNPPPPKKKLQKAFQYYSLAIDICASSVDLIQWLRVSIMNADNPSNYLMSRQNPPESSGDRK